MFVGTARKVLNISDDFAKQLITPHREVRGPFKGGLRFHPEIPLGRDHEIDVRTAAFVVAIQRVAAATTLRGL